MKLDKWPEEIECDGWRWKLSANVSCDCLTGRIIPRYISVEKLHVPPTMQEIFQHLIDGGWVKVEHKDIIGYWRLDKDGSKDLQVAYQERGETTLLRFNKGCDFTFAYDDMKVTLCKSGVADVYIGNTYVGSK